MRSIFVALTLIAMPLTAPLIAPTYAQAQSTRDMTDDVAKIGSWADKYNTIMTDMAAIFDNTEFNTFISDIYDPDVSIEDSQLTLDAWRADHKMRIIKIQSDIDNLPDVPQVRSAELNQIRGGLIGQRKALQPAFDDFIEIAQKLDDVAVKILDGDDEGIEELSVVMLDRAIAALISENAMLENSKNAIPDRDNPNFHLIAINQDINLFIIEEQRILKKTYSDQFDRTARRDNIQSMRRILDNAEKNLKLARESRKVLLAKMSKYKSAFPSGTKEAQLMTTAIAMMDEFSGAIDVEEDIIKLQRQSLSLYESEALVEEIEPQTLIINEKMYDLIDRRLYLVGERAKMAASLGG